MINKIYQKKNIINWIKADLYFLKICVKNHFIKFIYIKKPILSNNFIRYELFVFFSQDQHLTFTLQVFLVRILL